MTFSVEIFITIQQGGRAMLVSASVSDKNQNRAKAAAATMTITRYKNATGLERLTAVFLYDLLWIKSAPSDIRVRLHDCHIYKWPHD